MATSETEFKKWVVHNADKEWLIQPIETTTGSGIPDLFICYDGCSCWAELKATTSDSHCYMRISQWRWLKRLHSRGGWSILLIKRLLKKQKRVDIYRVSDLLEHPLKNCIFKGEDIYFPEKSHPAFSYIMGKGNKKFYEGLGNLLQEGFE